MTIEYMMTEISPDGRDKLNRALLDLSKRDLEVVKTHEATVPTKSGEYTYRYADLKDTFDALLPHMRELGLVFIQTTEIVGAVDPCVVLSTEIVHVESGQSVRSYFPVCRASDDSQHRGRALTYARRYHLQTMVGIAPEDPDADVAGEAMAAIKRTREEELPKLLDAIAKGEPQEFKALIDGLEPWQYSVLWRDLSTKQKSSARELLQAALPMPDKPPESEKDRRRVEVREAKA